MKASSAVSCKGSSSSEAESVPEESCLFLGDPRPFALAMDILLALHQISEYVFLCQNIDSLFSLKCSEHTFLFII